MDRLLGFAHERRDEGLEVDSRAISGRRLGRVQICEDIHDVEFAIRLPQPNGALTFVGTYFTP